ncbi:hypothetical protein DUI87_16263 [Hirundo rustica rustica]|uniref:Uncharacterized protein n=1 Tax=Hirundo rustica rustica TaxID=333673 RepID=A0A3M0K102_HIRRU|nr:hypothetical protein DUI87_16263 [Hirundo rustica rustica]
MASFRKDSVLSPECATVETPEALEMSGATLMTLEKSGGIVMFDKMWIFETNFSCFPFFRKPSCSMRVSDLKSAFAKSLLRVRTATPVFSIFASQTLPSPYTWQKISQLSPFAN